MSPRAWIGFVALRWFRARRSGGGFAATFLAAAGIATGCAALIVVLSVMNGFQLGFIESILELDSQHVRLQAPDSGRGLAEARAIAERLVLAPGVVAALPFSEREAVVLGKGSRAYPLRIKVVPRDATRLDGALGSRLELLAGEPPGAPGLAIGSELARLLGAWVGDEVSLLLVDADVEEGVSAHTVSLRVSGIFRSGYYEFDVGLGFADEGAASALGEGRPLVGVKLRDRFDAPRVAPTLAGLAELPAEDATSWETYNRSFFGALRLEKTIMMLLVGLIFVVVGISIFHAMRRAVFERMEDIAIIKALGGEARDLRAVFALEGFATGLLGAVAGAALGLALASNVNEALGGIEALVSGLRGLGSSLLALLRGDGLAASDQFRVFSPSSFYLLDVPSRPLLAETLFVAASGAASATAAAWLASARVPTFKPSEVLRDE